MWSGAQEPLASHRAVLPTCSNPIGATALIRVGEAALQVMGKAGERQVPGAKTALSHGWGGAVQFKGVMILSNTL